MEMQIEQVMAFETKTEPPGLEIQVNFGVFAGREVTPAEIDELGRLLVPEVGDVSIVAEDRHELGAGHEASVHLVRIEVPAEELPADGRDELKEKLIGLAEIWARQCIAERHADVADL
jgi:hypothetical protein